MAITTTTAAAAIAVADTQISVTSATGFAANDIIKVDEEFCAVLNSYVSGTIIPVRRALNGTVAIAHPVKANVVVGLPSDFASANTATIVPYGLAARRRKVVSYSAAGAIALPLAGEDIIAIINGTSALAMTVAVPTTDNDGAMLFVVGNGAGAHTITFTGGLSGAGTSYDVITVNATAPICVQAMAINGLWTSMVATPMAGTVTAITGTVA